MKCITEEHLSGYVDQELSPEMMALVREHISQCPVCEAKCADLAGFEKELQSAVLSRQTSRDVLKPIQDPESCPDETSLVGYLEGHLKADEEMTIERHLRECDACLMKVNHFAKLQALGAAKTRVSVPTPVADKVTALWESDHTNSTFGGAVEAVIQRIGDKLQVVLEHCKPENLTWKPLSLQPVLLRQNGGAAEPSPVGTSGVWIHKSFPEQNIELQLKVVLEKDESMGLEIALLKNKQAYGNCRLSLYQREALLISKASSSRGQVVFPKMGPGQYTLKIQKEKIAWSFCLSEPIDPDTRL